MLILNLFQVAYFCQIVLILSTINLNIRWIDVILFSVVDSAESNDNFTQYMSFRVRSFEEYFSFVQRNFEEWIFGTVSITLPVFNFLLNVCRWSKLFNQVLFFWIPWTFFLSQTAFNCFRTQCGQWLKYSFKHVVVFTWNQNLW